MTRPNLVGPLGRDVLIMTTNDGGQTLSPQQEEALLTGFLDGCHKVDSETWLHSLTGALLSHLLEDYPSNHYKDPRQLYQHNLTVCIPRDDDWYRLGFLAGMIFRAKELRYLLN